VSTAKPSGTAKQAAKSLSLWERRHTVRFPARSLRVSGNLAVRDGEGPRTLSPADAGALPRGEPYGRGMMDAHILVKARFFPFPKQKFSHPMFTFPPKCAIIF